MEANQVCCHINKSPHLFFNKITQWESLNHIIRHKLQILVLYILKCHVVIETSQVGSLNLTWRTFYSTLKRGNMPALAIAPWIQTPFVHQSFSLISLRAQHDINICNFESLSFRLPMEVRGLEKENFFVSSS